MSSVGANRYDNSAVRRERLLVVWNQEEDDLLREQVRLNGVDKWAKIATHFHGKTSRQCRRRMRVAPLEGVLLEKVLKEEGLTCRPNKFVVLRVQQKKNLWHMFLNVVNKRGGWTDEEDRLLLESHDRYGNRWTEIAKKLPGRTDNAVKNRYCVLCKKQARETETTVTGASSEEGAQHPDHHRDAQIPEPQEYKATERLTSVREEARTDANFHNWASESSLYPIQQREELISTAPPPYMNAQLWNALQTELHGRPSSAENSQAIHHSRRRGAGDMTSETLYPQTSNCGNMQQWEGFLAAVQAVERTSEAGPSDTSQFLESSQAAVTNSSSQPRRPLVDTSFIQQGKRPKIGEAGVGSTRHNRGLVPLSSSKPPNVIAELLPQQGSADGVGKRWNESDVKAMMSSSTYRGRNVLQDFEGFQKSLAGSSDENIEADENLAPLNDSSPKERLQQMVRNVEKLRGPLRQLFDDRTCSPSWASRATERTSRPSLKKSVFISTDICGDTRRGCDGEVVIFHAFMPYAPMADDLRHEIKVPVTRILKDENPCVLKTDSKRSETRTQSPCGGPLGVAASTSRHEECQEGPSGLKAEGMYEETMQGTCTSAECTPTPDKDRLLDQEIRLADCGSDSPVRPHLQYVRAAIPLIESRYDTPARSPLSSCLLPTVQSIHTVLRLS